jgi:hypothetical protein
MSQTGLEAGAVTALFIINRDDLPVPDLQN